jgi:hypothetical protein
MLATRRASRSPDTLVEPPPSHDMSDPHRYEFPRRCRYAPPMTRTSTSRKHAATHASHIRREDNNQIGQSRSGPI